MPCVTTDGLVVFVEAPSVPWDGAGHLASVALRRSCYSHRWIAREPDRRYHSPSPLRDGAVLVSSRSDAEGSTHGIYRLDPHTGEKKLVFDDPGYHDMHARVLAPCAEPDGRSSVVNEKYPTGKLYCLNAYLTDPPLTPHMKPGIIKNLRVIEGVPQPADAVSASPPDAMRYSERIVKKRLLGVVPVEEDGSFHIEVPADTPIQLQTLDADGLALRTCGWIWVKHREPRGCIGCHEDPELTPENRFVDALKRPGMKLTLPVEKRRTVDFRRDVVPIIAEKCARCHTGAGGGLDLRNDARGGFSRAYETLVAHSEATAPAGKQCSGRYVHVGQARTSPVLWRILGRNTSRPWDEAYRPGETYPTCPPLEAEQLTDDERLTFIEWIDLGAHWDGIPEVIRQPASSDRGVENEGEI